MGKVIDLFGKEVSGQLQETEEGIFLIDVDDPELAKEYQKHLKEVSDKEFGPQPAGYGVVAIVTEDRSTIKIVSEKIASDIGKTGFFQNETIQEQFQEALMTCAEVLTSGPIDERVLHFYQNPETGEPYVTDESMFAMVVADHYGVAPFANVQFAPDGPTSILAYIKTLRRDDPTDIKTYIRWSVYSAAKTTPAFDTFLSAYHSVRSKTALNRTLTEKMADDIRKAIDVTKEELNGLYTITE